MSTYREKLETVLERIDEILLILRHLEDTNKKKILLKKVRLLRNNIFLLD